MYLSSKAVLEIMLDKVAARIDLYDGCLELEDCSRLIALRKEYRDLSKQWSELQEG